MSARLRLTLSYAGFLFLAGLGLTALLAYVLRFVPLGAITDSGGGFVPDRDDLTAAVWPKVVVVLVLLAVVGLAGGWVLAGRMLRPLHRIHTVARQVAAGSLEDRVRLRGADREFQELADTFDAMLDELQRAFDEQRRFAANASHELRTPYAVERSMLDVALADPSGLDVDQFLRRLDQTNRRGTETVDALLTLAALDRASDRRPRPVDLAEVAAAVVRDLAPVAGPAGVTVSTRLGEGDVDGDEALVRQLVTNLVLNGVRHNTGPGGRVEVTTQTQPDGAVAVRVTNTGPVLPQAGLARLTEPFVRGAQRSAPGGGAPAGSGLGLSIVARIAEVHGAHLTLTARAEGGLQVDVVFPAHP